MDGARLFPRILPQGLKIEILFADLRPETLGPNRLWSNQEKKMLARWSTTPIFDQSEGWKIEMAVRAGNEGSFESG